ncbi:amidohydrolase family protein [Pseudonocardia broussonetiae]|uniref:2-amino-3-carboxymuconate-6-semialdehyde decarboxylase n=1 Tax=Pseudonocardia broussonetiae TaxID=2736640 RepID=A0A6M6JE93_9PSEU|nr:amidohydrolase family protein [Pseudonocardia broussonetiae]QJY45152.1 amidohydrolase [Pseudonocardia broussonetiae]
MDGVPYRSVDVHAHHLGTDLPELPSGAPRLVVDAAGGGRIVTADGGSRTVPSALWDVGERLAGMDRVGLSHQVLSPVPEVMEQAWSDEPLYARSVNDAIAGACAASGGRLIGLGCLPAADPAGELARCLALGLRGVEVGTRMGGLDLDADGFAGVWSACEAAGAAVLVHPVARGRDVLRRSGRQIEIGLGMPVDAAAAAFALVFGGVLARHPGLRVALTHGCGAFPWVYPRLRLVAPVGEWDALVRRLYVDTLVLDAEHLRLLVHRFGADRLLVGTDSPFMPEQFAAAAGIVDAAVHAGALAESARPDVQVHNALAFLGLS